MKLRKNFIPRSITDIGASIFLAICIPVTFWFEIFVVLPQFHAIGSFFYIFTFVIATFLLYNVTSNWLAVMTVDTSIKGEVLNPPDDVEIIKSWNFCAVCETLSPPRSFHCSTCKACILKRDHHCTFAGYCVGHKNQRYFLMLLIFLFISTLYTSFYNSLFFWWLHYDKILTIASFIQMIFPLAVPFFMSTGIFGLYLAIYEINLLGFILCAVLLYYHGSNALKGSIVYERKSAPKYDYGLRENIKIIFGERWYLTWISPFIVSKLPHDGIHWVQSEPETTKTK